MKYGLLSGALSLFLLGGCVTPPESGIMKDIHARVGEETRDQKLKRISREFGYSIDDLFRVEIGMKRSVAESLRLANATSLPSWEDYRTEKGYSSELLETDFEVSKYKKIFEQYLSTIRSLMFKQVDSYLNSGSGAVMVLLSEGDTLQSNKNDVQLFRGTAYLSSKIYSDTGTPLIFIDFYDGITRGDTQFHMNSINTAFETTAPGLPLFFVYRREGNNVQRLHGRGGTIYLDEFVFIESEIKKFLTFGVPKEKE